MTSDLSAAPNTNTHSSAGQHPEALSDPVGAVLVVGGGIAGMQASLDLAEQGFKVYLVEKKSAIGGRMAQLDKTFPTNDCAMCIISPKLVDTGRHHNIEILTNTEVQEISGEAGDFAVHLLQRPRYIDIDTCVACNECAEACPVEIPNQYNEGLNTRRAAYKLYPQAVPNAYAIEKAGIAPCRDACPAGQRAQGYIALIAQGRFQEALRVVKEDNPFPSVCGRTCHHPCENKCSLNQVDDPVNIMALKRFVVDYALAYGREKVEPVPRTRPEWIAIVGAGPAGLTAAHDLVKMGYGVTVHEALPVAGGMMRVGIPAHRLPKGVLQQDIDDILALGVVLKTNSPVEDPTELLEDYDAVCLATGISTEDHSLGLEGEDAKGVIPAATFLRKINLGDSVEIGNHVAVIGGGITALDAAAVARRLGSETVHLVLHRPRGELPAYQWEVEAIEAEGIHIHERTTATSILTEDGRVVGIEMAETTGGRVVDEQGRSRPKTKEGTEYTLDVDTVIGTVGQFSDLNYLDPRYTDLEVDQDTLASDIPGLFAVGGRATGASYIIDAIALGHKVAQSIHRYVEGQLLEPPNTLDQSVAKPTKEELIDQIHQGEIDLKPRNEPALLSMEERVTGFREVVLGLTEHQARAEAQRCLQCGICSECLACEYACDVDAINQDMTAQEKELRVGGIILAPGYQAYQPERSQEYGFGRYTNVVTSLQFERLLSASGPTFGKINRPSDDQEPYRIAFLQCIGSRDQEHDYCSSVCCMYATKEAVIAKEHHPDLDVHVFLMDMRAFSKGYWRYFQRAQEQYGVQYHHCRISELNEDAESHHLILHYAEEDHPNQIVKKEFDMVVLSVGMEMSESVKALGRDLGIELNEYGFCHTPQFNPVETSRSGIFCVGPFREPKDIPESVMEASGAAGSIGSRLGASRFSLTTTREFPPEIDVSDQEPRIGVFVCHCGSNIAGFLDVHQVTEYAKILPHVAHAESDLYACSQDNIKHITETVKEKNLNRVVVASCTPLTHQPLFQDSIRAAGLNPYLFEMANIRNQCSWVHSHDWDQATQKAKDLVRMAVSRTALLEAQKTVDVPVNDAALVVGGGPAGMTAALTLAESGFPVHLVEKEDQLGGSLRSVWIGHNGGDPQGILKELIHQVKSQAKIDVHLHTRVIDASGFMGNFSTQLETKAGQRQTIQHGVTILATGAEEYQGPEYGHHESPFVVTQGDFETMLSGQQPFPGEQDPEHVVMIQCVGPADNYCSRICCTTAIKNAIYLKKHRPEAEIAILYKDIRAYGFKESLYTEARDRGVIFIRYADQHPPQVQVNGQATGQNMNPAPVSVKVWDAKLRRTVQIHPDLLVLSMPLVPNPDTTDLASLFKVSIDEDGFFMEAHVKLRPVDFSTEGIFMAGTAHYPKLLDEAMIQAQAAASRAARVLSRETLTAGGRVAVVDPEKCTGCLTCVRICPFEVPTIQPDLAGAGEIMGAAHIEPAVCQGCGVCAAECPAYAIELMHYTDQQMRAKVRALCAPQISVPD
jgi:heterodisulfide reductase subunit A-like polyferredoxin